MKLLSSLSPSLSFKPTVSAPPHFLQFELKHPVCKQMETFQHNEQTEIKGIYYA